MKKELQARLAVAGFMQDTLHEMAVARRAALKASKASSSSASAVGEKGADASLSSSTEESRASSSPSSGAKEVIDFIDKVSDKTRQPSSPSPSPLALSEIMPSTRPPPTTIITVSYSSHPPQFSITISPISSSSHSHRSLRRGWGNPCPTTPSWALLVCSKTNSLLLTSLDRSWCRCVSIWVCRLMVQTHSYGFNYAPNWGITTPSTQPRKASLSNTLSVHPIFININPNINILISNLPFTTVPLTRFPLH